MGKRRKSARARLATGPRVTVPGQITTPHAQLTYASTALPGTQHIEPRRAPRLHPQRISAAMLSWIWDHRAALLWVGACAAAAVAPAILRALGTFTPVDEGLAALNFDSDRIALIDQVLAALLAGLMGAALTRRRGAAWLGGVVYYALTYLRPFVSAVLHPGLSPAGLPQVPDPGALTGTLLTLVGLGVTCAAIGAALGGAIGDVLTGPLIEVSRRLAESLRRRQLNVRAMARPGGLLLTSVLLLAACALAVGGVGNVMNYGPTNNIYRSVYPTGPANLEHGVVLQRTFVSPALGGVTRTYYIYLPPSYASEPTRRYPTLYLLHGGPGEPHNWVGVAQAPETSDALVARDKMRETILVSPDGNGPVYRFSKWANSFDGLQLMEDSIVKDLVPYIDGHYRTLSSAADRGIVGLSDGGYGAINIALHHPDIFSAAVSEGGYFYAEGPLFGSGPASESYRLYNSPAQYIFTPDGTEMAHRLTFIICVGTADGSFYWDGLSFVRELQSIGARVTLIKRTGGHSWTDWAQMFGLAAPLVEPAT